mmetsp:Transcript_5936/g.8983  ORF Transcript_5936/g.8983 Transcript_5936/m.8983 type:complete len:325 (+) Transcript_5936:277-1251(+)|eukprot:CAMPEP_0117009964 /NCGR_PEP_ID=MMETSP0472-20121206/8910_1 /TAXON_ID=693140 ORGANISM="Tiarina fusus, Strain LIS" /NCGR_SAMPLE_ID=MMETSP0472 /ASSEMBLY_ACC=CAM_ASM_000603 /LENGTH=324 /DNA_ID=CAMNT_0004712391 /DNA_START=277 /DNA_END=1251 /DNA_ORIENTATION=-
MSDDEAAATTEDDAPPVAEVQTSTDNDGDGERKLMEEELLQDMIRDRETSLKMIRKKLEQQSEKMAKTKTQLAELRKRASADQAEQQMEIETLGQRRNKLFQQYREAKECLDMKKQQAQGAQLHIYNEVMKSVAAPESRDSSYVMRMQAQLCKAMHSMGMVETQFAMATQSGEAIQKYLKEVFTGTVEEKSQVELRLMNDLMMEDSSRRDVETKHNGMMDAFIKERDGLVARMELQKEEPPEEDDDEEKEELMEILTQGREEIERMEAENKEELARLEALKIKAIEAKGADIVEDIVGSIEEEWKERERQRLEEMESSDEEDSD